MPLIWILLAGYIGYKMGRHDQAMKDLEKLDAIIKGTTRHPLQRGSQPSAYSIN